MWIVQQAEGLGWLMDVGRYQGVAPSMWAFAAWFWRMSGSCAIYVPKKTFFLQCSTLWQLQLCLAPENGPHQVPRKRAFSWVSQRNLTLGGVRFPGANPTGKLAPRWFPPFFSQHQAAFSQHQNQAGNAHIDGATPRELRHLCPKKAAWCWEKIMGRNQRRRLQKICHV